MSAHFSYTDPATGTEFQWHGGEYIEIGYTATQPTGPFNDKGQASYEPGEFVASDVINVWDYETSSPTIDRDLDAFEQRCREYIDGDDED